MATLSGNVANVTSATITWGDGTQTSGTWSGSGTSITISGTHTYADEGSYPLSVSVQMSQGGPLTASGPATVNDAALTPAGVTLSATAGVPLAVPPGQVVVATFTDVNPSAPPGDFSAQVSWGDGSTSAATIGQQGNVFQVLGNHTYADAGSYTVSITIDDVGGSTATTASTVNVGILEGSDYALSLQVAAPGGAQASSGTSYTALIAWGDGATSAGTVSVVTGTSPLQLLVSGDHVYTEEGSYPVTVTVTDPSNNQSTASTTLAVVDAPLTGYGLNVGGAAGTGTAAVTLGGFTDQNAYAPASDFSVSISWGDNTPPDTTTGKVVALSGGSFQVTGSHDYASAGSYTVTVTVTDDGGQSTTFTATAAVAAPWSVLSAQSSDDPEQAYLTPVGEATVDLNQGALRLSQSLDFDQSPGTDVGRNPALVYNSATADVLPTLQLSVQGDPNAAAPTQAVVQLTWNGVAQTPVTYSLNQPAGSVYLFGVQPNAAVTASGAYGWSATLTFTFPDNSTKQVTTSGTAYVVSQAASAYGAGWGIDGVSQLVIVPSGVLLVTGQGDSRFFAGLGGGAFRSPAEDFGTLAQNQDGSYTYTARDQTRFNYGSAGYLTSVVDTHGLSTTYQYDSQDRLTQVTAVDGGVTRLAYDPTTGLLDTITEPGNRVLTLTHDSSGNLTGITDVDNTTRTFGYATPSNHLLTQDQWAPLNASFSYTSGLLTQVNLGLGSVYNIVSAAAAGLGTQAAMGAAWATITDGDGHTTRYLLDTRGRLLQQVQGDGTSTTTYVRNAAGLPTLTVDPMGRPTFDTYDAWGDVLKETAADGSWAQYQYDPTFHEVTQTLNSLGEKTTNTYDPVTGDLLTSTDATGAVTAYSYYQTNGISNGLVYQVTSPAESGTATTTNLYDAARRLLASFDARGVPTYYGYDANGNPSTTTDVYGHVTQTVYSPRNLLLQQIDALGAVTAYAYNAYGQRTSVTDARGFTSTTTYDQRGWVVAQTDDEGVTTESDSYDAAGNRTLQADALGNATSYAFDADNRQTLQVDAAGDPTTTAYDADGEVTATTDALGRTTNNAYNLVGEQTATADPMGRTTRSLFDAAGNLIRNTDATGLSELDFYDADNRRVEAARQAGLGAWAADLTQYDKAGDVTATADPDGHVTRDNLDADGEQVGTVDAAGHTTGDVYDLAGNLIQSVDANGKTTQYLYDADNRQVAAIDADGNVTWTVYDADGNAVETIDPKGNTTTSLLDADGRVTAAIDADGHTTQTAYDADGNVTQTIDASGGVTNHWYDAVGREVLTEDADGNYEETDYNAVGDVVDAVDGDGNLTQTGYDGDGEVTSVRDALGRVTQNGYNADGQQTSSTDGAGHTTRFVLDALGETVAEVDPRGLVSQSRYDLAGHLVASVDAAGHTSSSQYDGDGNRTLQVDAAGHTSSFAYDGDGNQTLAVTGYGTGAASTTTSQYDGDGNLTLQVDGARHTSSYAYDADGNQTLAIQGYGTSAASTTTSEYDGDGNLTLEVDGAGQTSSYAYDADGNQTLAIRGYGTAAASTTTSEYDADGNLLWQVDGAGHTSSFAYDGDGEQTLAVEGVGTANASTAGEQYDGDGEVTLSVDGNRHSTSYAFDLTGNETLRIDGYGTSAASTTSSGYDADGNLTLQVDGAGHTTSYAYDADNNQTLAIQGYGTSAASTTTSQYDGDGNLTLQVDGARHTSTFAFDADGNQTLAIQGYGTSAASTTTSRYDGDGNLTLEVDGDGHTSSYAFDADGNETLSITGYGSSAASTTTSLYDGDGNLTLQVDGDGHTSSYAFDTDGNQTLAVSGYGSSAASTTTSRYDGDGNLTLEVDGAGHTSSYAYDADGNQTLAVQGYGTSSSATTSSAYDGDGNVTLQVDADGHTSSYAYDADGNQTLSIVGYGSSAAASTHYVYDGDGNVLEEVDPDGNTTSYAYDADGNQTLRIEDYGSSVAATTSYSYDGDGDLTLQVNPNGTSRAMSYDADGNLLTETWYASDGHTVTNVSNYTYDADGNVLTAGNNAGTYHFAYEADGRQTQVVTPSGVTLNYQYDGDGNVVQVSDSLGQTVSSQYDADGRLTQRSYSGPNSAQLLLKSAYDADGNLTGVSRYADLAGTQLVGTSTETYDAQSRLTGISHQNAANTVLASYGYGYDLAGLLTSEVDNGTTTAYGYDATGQLVSAGGTSYGYDANGNPTGSGVQVGAGNQLLSDGTWNYRYDADGNLMGKTGVSNGLTWAFSYDAANQLIGATETNSANQTLVQSSYVYDVFGHRIQSSVSTNGGAPVVTNFVYNGDTLWATLNGSGGLVSTYVSGDGADQWLARVDAGGTVNWLLTDHLGSVRAVMNNPGQVVASANYDAFGNPLNVNNAAQLGSLMYAGYWYDAELGAYHDGDREYGPDIRRYWQRDPSGLGPDSNDYRYTKNGPTNATDPTGLRLVFPNLNSLRQALKNGSTLDPVFSFVTVMLHEGGIKFTWDSDSIDASGNSAETWAKARKDSPLPAAWWDFVHSASTSPERITLNDRDVIAKLGLPPSIRDALPSAPTMGPEGRTAAYLKVLRTYEDVGRATRALSAQDLVLQWMADIGNEADYKAQYDAQQELQDAQGKDAETRAVVAEEVASRREEFEKKTPGLTGDQRKAAAPWWYGDNKYFRPQVGVDEEGQETIIFTPTAALRRLQLQQALTLGLRETDPYGSVGRDAPFSPPRTAAAAVRWYELYGETNPSDFVTRAGPEGGLEGSSSDLAILTPVGALRKAGSEALWWFFVKGSAEIATNAAISAAAEKVAEKFHPAAGAVVPFVPTILGLMTRKAIRSPALRRAFARLRAKTTGATPQGGRWIGSKLSPEQTEAAVKRMAARLKGLKAGGQQAIEEVEAFGSRAGSTFRGRGPIETSDLDLFLKDRPGAFEGSRFDSGLRQKIKQITDDFTKDTGIKVDWKIHSDDPFMRTKMAPPFEKLP